MRLIANIIWILTGGLTTGILWAVTGGILCMTVVGIPLGMQCFKAARLTFAPYGKQVTLKFLSHPIANTIWVIFAGWELFISYLITAAVCCVTIIGIPVGIQAFKFSRLALAPFGAEVR